ncbi:MAG: hypothetical protein Q9160_002314 [Pyrenula sp. 1 TL-2023]
MGGPESFEKAAQGHNGAAKPVVKDSRFADFETNPRWRLPSKRHARVKVDKRFSRMLRDDDFARKAKVDRYGRPLQSQSEKSRLKRLYNFDENDEPDDDDEVVRELKRVKQSYDPIRDGGYGSSSDSSSEEDEADEEGVEEKVVETAPDSKVPMGEISSRIAVVNLDWDHIRAADLMAVFSSFLPSGGSLIDVSIYPSEFGKERMEREEFEGPPKEIFTSKTSKPSATDHAEEEEIEDNADDNEGDNEENIKRSIIKPDNGEDFDSAKLRDYQLERLRYFYAILACSSTSVAKSIYDAVDGTEYLSSSNFFDLRFVPDGTEFSADKARDSCQKIPEVYKPNEFVTTALQHSRVKLTWDADDLVRKEAQARAFRGGRKEIDENDLKAYLGSDSSDDNDDDQQTAGHQSVTEDGKPSKKEAEKQKMRALLGLSTEPVKSSKNETPVGDMQITFTSGLSENQPNGSVFVNEPDETTVEKYVRKEKERKQRRKDKSRQVKDGDDHTEVANLPAEAPPEEEDLGFDDPFFAANEDDTKSASARRKEERRQRRAERELEEAASANQRRELELLMVDDKEAGVKHFNLDEIEKAQKRSKKNKKAKYRKAEGTLQPESDDFEMNVDDPRFSRIFENHEYAIDPSNPRFRKTEGMQALLDEGRKRREQTKGERRETRKSDAKVSNKQPRDPNDLRRLVEKVRHGK